MPQKTLKAQQMVMLVDWSSNLKLALSSPYKSKVFLSPSHIAPEKPELVFI